MTDLMLEKRYAWTKQSFELFNLNLISCIRKLKESLSHKLLNDEW